MPTYRIHTKAGQKGPFTLRVILRGLETGKIPKTATLEEVETGRQIKAAEVLGETSRESNSQRQCGSSDIPLEASAPLELLESDLDPLPSFRPMQQPPGSVQAPHNAVQPSQASFHHGGVAAPTIVNVHPGSQDRTTPMMALVGFVSSLLCCWPLGLAFSILGYRDSKRRGGAGMGLSIAGILISGSIGLLSLLWFVLFVVGLGVVGSAATSPAGTNDRPTGNQQLNPDTNSSKPQSSPQPKRKLNDEGDVKRCMELEILLEVSRSLGKHASKADQAAEIRRKLADKGAILERLERLRTKRDGSLHAYSIDLIGKIQTATSAGPELEDHWLWSSGDLDGWLQLLDRDGSGIAVVEFKGHSGRVLRSVFSHDGKQVLTVSEDKTARLWDASTGKEMKRFLGHTEAVNGALFSPSGKQVLTVSLDNTARLWDVVTGNELKVLIGHANRIRNADFSPDGKTVLTASDDTTARLWDVATGRELQKFLGHTGGVNRAVFSPDGQQLVTASADKTARLWGVATGKELKKFEGHTDTVLGAVFSPDGKLVYTVSSDSTARMWDAATGVELEKSPDYRSKFIVWVNSLDGKRALEVNNEYPMVPHLWDVETSTLLTVFKGHTGRVNHAVFSPDGKKILTASDDNTARLWDPSAPK